MYGGGGKATAYPSEGTEGARREHGREGERQAARPGLDTNPARPRHCCSLQLPCGDLLVHAGPTETCGYQGTRGMAWAKTGGEPALWRRAQPGVQSHCRAPSSTTLELRDISIIHLRRAWAGACPSHPWAPRYGFMLATSPGPPTSQLRFILCLYVYPAANRHDLEIADDA